MNDLERVREAGRWLCYAAGEERGMFVFSRSKRWRKRSRLRWCWRGSMSLTYTTLNALRNRLPDSCR